MDGAGLKKGGNETCSCQSRIVEFFLSSIGSKLRPKFKSTSTLMTLSGGTVEHPPTVRMASTAKTRLTESTNENGGLFVCLGGRVFSSSAPKNPRRLARPFDPAQSALTIRRRTSSATVGDNHTATNEASAVKKNSSFCSKSGRKEDGGSMYQRDAPVGSSRSSKT
jgi:hypothetical protein